MTTTAKPLSATQTLPAGYRQVISFDLRKKFWLAVVLNVAAIILLGLFGWLVSRFSQWVRPDFWEQDVQSVIQWMEMISFGVAIVLMLVFHEGLHGLFFWVFTKARPKFGFSLLYAYAAAPDWYIPRNAYLVVGLAPLVVITLVGLVMILWMPHVWLPATLFLVALNAAGAVGDMYVTLMLLAQKPDVLVNDVGAGFTIYAPVEEVQGS